jgi:hypothetical protein
MGGKIEVVEGVYQDRQQFCFVRSLSAELEDAQEQHKSLGAEAGPDKEVTNVWWCLCPSHSGGHRERLVRLRCLILTLAVYTAFLSAVITLPAVCPSYSY